MIHTREEIVFMDNRADRIAAYAAREAAGLPLTFQEGEEIPQEVSEQIHCNFRQDNKIRHTLREYSENIRPENDVTSFISDLLN